MKIAQKAFFQGGGHFFDGFLEGQYEGENGPEYDQVSDEPAQV